MGLFEAQGNLSQAWKSVQLKWLQTRIVWTDKNADAFESKVLTPLERDVKSATEAMASMSQLVSQAKRDCR